MRNILIICLLFCAGLLNAQDSASSLNVGIGDLRIVGLKNIYPTYLADPLGNRSSIGTQYMKYSDLDFADEINSGGDYRGHLVISPAIRMSLFQFRPKNNPKLGIEGEIGVMLPLALRQKGNDMIGLDGIYYFALSGNPTEWLFLRFSKHHICTHIGDEFTSGTVNSVSDVDPAKMRAGVNDDFRVCAAVKPLYFIGREDLNILTVYGEVGYFQPGTDFLGERQSKPHTYAYMNYLAGADIEYYFAGRFQKAGGLFAGFNWSVYQENGFSPNINYTAGYLLPQEKYKIRMRIGVQYYNGRSLMNQFYYKKERFVGFYLAFDV